jgi:prolyl-tRNA synthetase
VKFKDADLIGIPLRVVIGGKGLKEGQVEVRWRWETDSRRVPVGEAVVAVENLIRERKAADLAKVPQ